MKSRTSFAALVTPLVLALSALCAPAAFAAPATGESIVVVAVRGDVQVAGAARAVRAGSAVATPATIRTGRDGFIELRQGGTTASVAADSEIEIAAPDTRQGLVERIVQTRGNVYYDVAKRSGRKLRVETAYLVAVIKGTQFNVAAQADSATVSLFEGRLEIWTADAADVVELNAGEIATRGRNDPTIRVLRMDSGETIRARADTPNDGTRTAGTRDEPSAHSPAANVAATVHGPVVDRSSPHYSPVAGGVGNTEPVRAAVEPLLDVDGKTASVGVGQSLNVGVVRADTGVNAGLDLGASGVTATVNVGASVGVADAVAVTANTAASIDLGGASGLAATANIGASVGVLDTVSVSADTTASVDLGAGTVTASTGATADLGATSVDVGVTATADVPAGSVDLGASVVAADTTVAATTAVDVTAGTIDAGVTAGPVDAAVGVDLGTGSATVDIGDTTITTPPIPVVPAVIDELVKPLRGLLGR